MGRWRLFFPVTGRKRLDCVLSVVSWLFVIGMGITMVVQGLVLGLDERSEGFGFGGLWILYDVHSGGLLGDRLVYAIITEVFPEHQGQRPDYTWEFAFPGGSTATVRPGRGETVWINKQGHIVSLGRALGPKDIAAIQTHSNDKRPAITSLEEFLVTITKLREQSRPGQ